MVAIYVRVSTQQQVDRWRYPAQRKAGTDFALSLGDEYVIYEEAESGADRLRRKEWMRLESDLKRGMFLTVWVADCTRFARRLRDALNMWHLIEETGAKLYVGEDHKYYSENDDNSVMEFQIKGMFAERERKQTLARAQEGIREQINAGHRPLGHCYGYKRIWRQDGTSERVIVESEAQAIRRMFHLYVRESLSGLRVAERLNDEGYTSGDSQEWRMDNVIRRLKISHYAGLCRNTDGKLIKNHKHQPIITERFYHLAQAQIKRNTAKSFRFSATHLCSGLVRCGHCRAGYHYANQRCRENEFRYYRHRYQGSRGCPQKPKNIRVLFLENLFSVIYLAAMFDRENIKHLHRKHEEQLATALATVEGACSRLNSRLHELVKQRTRLVDSIAEGVPARAIAPKLQEIDAETREIDERKVKSLQTAEKAEQEHQAILAEFSTENVRRFLQAETRERRDLLARVIHGTVDNGMLHVDLIGGQRLEIDLNAWKRLPLMGKKSLSDIQPAATVLERAEAALEGNDKDRAKALRELTMLAVRLGLLNQDRDNQPAEPTL